MSGHSHEIRLTVNGEEFCESVEARQTLDQGDQFPVHCGPEFLEEAQRLGAA